MPIPAGIENLSTTPASNNPAGSENVSEGDDHLRNLYAFLRQSFTAGADIASASTITPPSTGGSFNLTGTTTVTAIATTNSWSGRKIRFRHTGAHSFTQSSSLVCPGGVSITFANGDISEWAQNPSGGWEIVTYVPALYISAPYFNATGTTIPAVGIYRPSANTLGFATNTTLFASMNSTGNWTFSPSSGNAITINSSFNAGISITDATVTGVFYTAGAGGINFGTTTAHALNLFTGNGNRVILAAAGNVSIAAPSSGTTLSLTGTTTTAVDTLLLTSSNAGIAQATFVNTNAGAAAFAYFRIGMDSSSDAGLLRNSSTNSSTGGAGSLGLWNGGNFPTYIGTNSQVRLLINGAGNVTINAPTSGVTLTVSGFSGTHSTKIADSATNSFDAGFLVLPVSGSTTAALSDRGKGIVATGTITIPNATFAAGDVLAIYNNSGASITISASITTMRLHGTATTGSRTLAQRGFASVYFVSGTECVVTGDVT